MTSIKVKRTAKSFKEILLSIRLHKNGICGAELMKKWSKSNFSESEPNRADGAKGNLSFHTKWAAADFCTLFSDTEKTIVNVIKVAVNAVQLIENKKLEKSSHFSNFLFSHNRTKMF